MSNIVSTKTTKSTAEIVKYHFDKNREAIMRSLPKGFNYDRICRAVINAISINKSLMECTPTSIFLSTIKAFSLGIEPNSPLQEGYLIPFNNRQKGAKEAQFMPSYRGLIQLARRSGEIKVIYAREVYKNDEIEIVDGTERKLIHKPKFFEKRGDLIGFYAVFTTRDGSSDFEVMSKGDVEDIRKRSKSPNEGPWVTDYNEMGRKTVIKKISKRMPMSIEFARAVEEDNKALDGKIGDVIDIEGLEIPPEEPKKTSTLEQPLTPKKAEERQQPTPADVFEDTPSDEFQDKFTGGRK